MVKHGHRSMEAGLGRGILRGVVLAAPPGLPGGAMERTRGGECGPDLFVARVEVHRKDHKEKKDKDMVWVCALGLRPGWASASEERSPVVS